MQDDDAGVLSAYQSHASYLTHYANQPDAEKIVAAAKKWATEIPRLNFQFAVVLDDVGTLIGCAGLRQRGYPQGEAEIGVEIDPRYWRNGFAREAVSGLIDFGVTDLGLASFWGVTARSNHPAQSLVRELGFVEYDSDGDAIRLRFDTSE